MGPLVDPVYNFLPISPQDDPIEKLKSPIRRNLNSKGSEQAYQEEWSRPQKLIQLRQSFLPAGCQAGCSV